MEEKCENCISYKKKGTNVGFCKEKTKIVKASQKEECFKLELDIIDNKEKEPVKEKIIEEKDINNYKKIIIREGKKIYI